MQNIFYSSHIIDSDEAKILKYPMILGIVLVYLATLFLQNIEQFSLRSVVFFTIAIALHLLIYLFSNKIFKHRYWLYFLVQGIIIFDCAVILPQQHEVVFIGLIPILVLQSMIVYSNSIKVIMTALFLYSLFCGTIVIFDGAQKLIEDLPLFILISAVIRIYSAIFLKQLKLRVQTQKVLQELELAYEKVEELTLINERQRMARDLHDTLSQGLAGIIMQLEAVNTHLNNNNVKRAQEIVQKSMEHARKTLSDSRLVIDDLRLEVNADVDFVKAVENEITNFKAISNTSVAADIRIESQISFKIYKHILCIIREALNNIAKHAEAKNAVVKIIENDYQINITIIDDGIGFDVKLLDQLFGHYGILGMTERVKAIHGKIKIKSKKKSGTNLNIIIPIEKGVDDENE